jgi:hypothetical protein
VNLCALCGRGLLADPMRRAPRESRKLELGESSTLNSLPARAFPVRSTIFATATTPGWPVPAGRSSAHILFFALREICASASQPVAVRPQVISARYLEGSVGLNPPLREPRGKSNIESSPAALPATRQTQTRNEAGIDNEPKPAPVRARPRSEAAVQARPAGPRKVLPPPPRLNRSR